MMVTLFSTVDSEFYYLLASRKVTSLSSSKSFLLPTRRIMIAGLAKVRASVNQLVRALNVSRDEIS